MRDFEVKQVSLNFKWNFKTIIPSLPVIGTEAFGVLCKKLSPFGLSASKIIIDSPSNKLGDTNITIILLDERLGVKFSIASFEIISDDFNGDDEKNIVDIAEIIFSALIKIDEDVKDGNANINLRCHLKLNPDENLKILSEHLNLTNSNPNLSPGMAIYQVDLNENSSMESARVAIADSLAYKDSIFFDLSFDYSGLGHLNEFAANVKNDVVKIFKTFGFNGEIINN